MVLSKLASGDGVRSPWGQLGRGKQASPWGSWSAQGTTEEFLPVLICLEVTASELPRPHPSHIDQALWVKSCCLHGAPLKTKIPKTVTFKMKHSVWPRLSNHFWGLKKASRATEGPGWGWCHQEKSIVCGGGAGASTIQDIYSSSALFPPTLCFQQTTWKECFTPCSCLRENTFTLFHDSYLEKEMAIPGESHGQRSLVGYSQWGCKDSDMTEALTYTHTR